MIKDEALRHQIILPQLQRFYDYWRSLSQAGQLPSRDKVDPSEIATQLPMVTLTEPISTSRAESSNRYQFRLAGTGFWRFYGDDIQGQYVDELPIGCRADYWQRVLDRVVDQRKPFHGVTKPNTPLGSHMAQFWIRLPLSDDGVNVNMILGYDHICMLEDVAQPQKEARKVYA